MDEGDGSSQCPIPHSMNTKRTEGALRLPGEALSGLFVRFGT